MSDAPTGDLALMRELNQRIVLDLIRSAGPISRAELARRSNLSRSTVSSIIADLLAADLVHEVGIGDSQGGRRPIMLAFNERSSYVVGVELANTTITILVCDLQLRVLWRTQQPLDLALGPSHCLHLIGNAIRGSLASAGVSLARVIGIGVGVPGPLVSASGRLIAPPIMPGWDGVPLRDVLTAELGSQVLVENDANLAALAEQRWGAARGWQHVAYIYLGKIGVGSGLILDGRLYRGDVGSAGEIGHLTIDEHGPLCRCGSRGCLEALIGTQALLAQARQAGLEVADLDALICLAKKEDPIVIGILHQAGERLGVAIASLINLLNPGCVVIGGGLTAVGDPLLQPLQATQQQRGLSVASHHVTIRLGALGSDVVAMGAAAVVIERAFDSPLIMNVSAAVRHFAPMSVTND